MVHEAGPCKPPGAVRIHQGIKSLQSIASHWGTFKLSDERFGEPPSYLKKALKEMEIEKTHFLIMKAGETRSFSTVF
jgi:N-acyl-phosphatidylethanolamine-hydrolysing phospholipase D